MQNIQKKMQNNMHNIQNNMQNMWFLWLSVFSAIMQNMQYNMQNMQNLWIKLENQYAKYALPTLLTRMLLDNLKKVLR
jgi:hypothetical protein